MEESNKNNKALPNKEVEDGMRMLKIKRLISIMVVLTIISNIGWNIPQSFAAIDEEFSVAKVKQKYNITDNSIALEWESILNADTYQVSYDKEYLGARQTVSKDVYTTETTINNLYPGFVYEFRLNATDQSGQELITPSVQDDYKVKAMTGIANFEAHKIDEVISENMTETGTNPGLMLTWDKLQYFDEINNTYAEIPKEQIDYEINIRKSKSSTADTVERFRIEYSNSDSRYYLRRWDGSQFVSVDVASETEYALDTDDDDITFNWTKVADELSGIIDVQTGQLKESALSPGSIYYIQLYPRFNTSGEFANVKYVETELEKDFVTTYLHIELVRHSTDNAMMTVYRVRNDGSFVTVPNFMYEFWVGPEQNNLNRSYYEREEDAGSAAESYIDAFLANTASFSNYYMVTATADETSDGDDPIVLTSQKLQVNLSQVGTSLPPMPENMEIVDVSLNEDKTAPIIKIRWDKPSNYEQMVSDGNYQYHLLLNTAIDDLYDNSDVPITEKLYDLEDNFLGSYDIKYREAINVPIQNGALEIVEVDDLLSGELNTGSERLEYTLTGENLFTDSEDNYPQTLLLNKVYYLKMYTEVETTDGDITSNNTLPITFTTPRYRENKPTLPSLISITEVTDSSIQLAWEKVDIEDEAFFETVTSTVYYEVSLSRKQDREVVELDELEDEGAGKYGAFEDPVFTITNEGSSDLVSFLSSERSGEIETTINGDNPDDVDQTLDPNTTYYILVRTKVVSDDGGYDPVYSSYSQTLTATTLKTEIEGPSDDEIYPLAPDDFAIAEDVEGNLLIDNYSVTLNWSDVNDSDSVTYNILRTERSVENISEWDGEPASLPAEYMAEMISEEDISSSYREDTEDYLLTLDDLLGNKVYFFSIRAEKTVVIDGEESVYYSDWITIPVTTLILEAPTGLSVVEVEDDDEDYDDFNKYHEVKITWKGFKQYNSDDVKRYDFDIAIKADDEDDYTIISTTDTGRIENLKSWQNGVMVGTNYEWYSTIISDLKSNTKYSIKIRIVDADGTSVSKFTEIVTTRTEFSNSDYDDDEQELTNDVTFIDSITRFKNSLYWVYDNNITSSTINYKIKVRGSKAVNHIRSMEDDTFTIDFSSAQQVDDDKKSSLKVYIPIKVVEVLDETNKTLVLHTINGDFVFRPGVFDTVDNSAIEKMMSKKENKSSVEDVYVTLTIKDIKDSSKYEPSSGLELVSNITSLGGEAIAFAITDDELEEWIYEELYGSDGTGETNGLVYEMREELQDIDPDIDELEEEIEDLLDEIEEELGEYIEDIITDNDYIEYTDDMDDVPKPIAVKLKYSTSSTENNNTISGYEIEGSGKWTKVRSKNSTSQMVSTFEINGIDEYKLAVIKESRNIYDVSNHEYQQEIQYMNNRFNIAHILTNSSYIQPETNTNTKDAILLFEAIMYENSKEYSDSDLSNKAQEWGLDKVINTKRPDADLTREQVAFILMKLYEMKTYSSIETMTSSKSISFFDEKQINSYLYKSVQSSVDLEIMQAEDNLFNPKGKVTRGEFITFLKYVLEKLEQ